MSNDEELLKQAREAAHAAEDRDISTRKDEEQDMGLELGLDAPGWVCLWGADGGGLSWAGQGWIDLRRSDLEWLRDQAIPAALERMDSWESKG